MVRKPNHCAITLALLFLICFIAGADRMSVEAGEMPANAVKAKDRQTSPAPPGKSAFLAMIKKVPIRTIPPSVNDKSHENLDTSATFSKKTAKALRLPEIMPDLNYKCSYIPAARFKIDSSFVLLLVFQYKENEIYGDLVKYTQEGDLVDHAQVFYDEFLESMFSTSTSFKNDSTMIISSNFSYGKDHQRRDDTVLLSHSGSFYRHPPHKPVKLKLNGADYSALFARGCQSSFSINGALSEVNDRNRITDIALLKTLWPDTAESYRYDTTNKAYFYSYQSNEARPGLQEFTVAFQGGCLDLWYFIFNAKGRACGKFALSRTCASDAEDYSWARFLTNDTAETVSTWTNEYPQPGENPNKRKIARYAIDSLGSVRERGN
jgi:hypothetical protein